jgi:predicted nucleotide-binding protein
MPSKKTTPELTGMAPDDPRFPLKIARLKEARGAIASFLNREPQLEDPAFDEWEHSVNELLKEVFGASGYLLRFRQVHIRPISYFMGEGPQWHAEPNEAWRTGLPYAERILSEAIEEAEIVSGAALQTTPVSATKREHGNRAFVVHGHDEAARETVARFLEKLNVEAIILHEKPTEGRTVIEKLEHYADVDFAVVLLTPDDVGSGQAEAENLQKRARQNVVLELGYFVGRLGRKKVCALYSGPLELPSDYLGVVYVQLDIAGGWRFQLAKELKSDGFNIDMNRAL